MGTFQRNAIISGYINSYCLVCERFLETDQQTFSHINEDDHENTLLKYPYLEKYGNNGIRKVKVGYFCEYCSQLMATGAKVNLHIAEKMHYVNKGNMLLKQSGSAITAFDDVLITENAWHSFHEDECLMCDVEFDDQTEHMEARSHLLKLLQSKVQFGTDNSVYRMIDKNYFQCLTCNVKQPINEFNDHFNSDIHKQRYVECQEEKKKHDLANAAPKEKTHVGKEDLKITVGQDNVDNNKENIAGIAVGNSEANKKAFNTVTTNMTNGKPAELQMIKEKKAKIKTEPKKPDFIIKEDSSDPATYAKDNQLIFDAKNKNAFCRTCICKFSSSLHALKEHVNGRDHKNKLAKALPKSPSLKHMKLFRTIMDNFVTHLHIFNNTLDNDAVINEDFCIPEKSWNYFTKIPTRFGEYTCQICMVDLSDDDLREHCRTAKHTRGMRETPIITNPQVKQEFIREVRPETFHCGFCNIVLASWHATEAHIKKAEHKNNAAHCHRRLQMHLPEIRAVENDDKLKAALFEMFFKHNMRM